MAIRTRRTRKVAARNLAVRKLTGMPARRSSREELEARLDRVQKLAEEVHLAHREAEQSRKETEQRRKEQSRKEAEQRRMEAEQSKKDLDATVDEFMKTANKMLGEFGNTLGSLMEHVMTPDLPRKFREFGFSFTKIEPAKLKDEERIIYAEIDGLMETEEQVMVVEVKTTLRVKDVDNHLKRMERIRIHADEKGDNREYFGAIAGAIMGSATKRYALSKGLFVIEPSGEDVTVIKPTGEPQKW
ncbi:MAG: hypothetical protein LBU99_06360 [Spirochaetaceae bacterium]|jgi:hypothetical protein|nr:hypothetical protein [Spirochaetaceae bacterium]